MKRVDPKIGERCVLAENAASMEMLLACRLQYRVRCGSEGDVNPIRIGDRVNIRMVQFCILIKRAGVEVGNDVT